MLQREPSLPTALRCPLNYLYLDEVQLCNPIESYGHKIVFVYFAIENLDLKFRSTFKFINLLSVFYNHQVNEFHLMVVTLIGWLLMT